MKVWYITERDSLGNKFDVHTFYERDEVAVYLGEMDAKGYCVEGMCFESVHDSPFELKVELDVRYSNFALSNISDLLPQILGEPDYN